MESERRLWCRPCQDQLSYFERDQYAPCEYGQCVYIKTEAETTEPPNKMAKQSTEGQLVRLTSTPTDVQVF